VARLVSSPLHAHPQIVEQANSTCRSTTLNSSSGICIDGEGNKRPLDTGIRKTTRVKSVWEATGGKNDFQRIFYEKPHGGDVKNCIGAFTEGDDR
jgi:hypothetical protein